MQKTAKHKIVIIGCGNVAWHLAKQFTGLKKYELFVYNHRANNLLNDFKTKLKCSVSPNLNKIITDADFYFICVVDKNISSVAKKIKIKNPNAIVIHTSGSAKINELGEKFSTAVFYPLQTFSKHDEVNWKETPIIVEAKNATIKTKILNLAKDFSNNVSSLNYKERLTLHLAAVLVNNFTNALFVAAGDLVGKDKKMLLPLIKQTVLKIQKLDPRAAQTGPAKRGDKNVMEKHLKLLSSKNDIKKTYKQLSSLIVKQQTKHA
ncbi:MAG: DUF2520 domain-containing protein [Bacteroidota bacterium]|nr:DUF2520 domain-containing protein [Bacteroidota bacterium]